MEDKMRKSKKNKPAGQSYGNSQDNCRETFRYPLADAPEGALLKTETAALRGERLKGRPGQGKIRMRTTITANIQNIKQGYSIHEFESLKSALGISGERLTMLAGISPATMHRRKSSGVLTPDESEKIYRLRKIYDTAMDVLENEENVKTWLNTPQRVFEGKKPLDYADTLPGCEEVERVLRRMELGIVQ
jgi:putative toxin-antitoxin system antitoxin component (TIGR02293 family)